MLMNYGRQHQAKRTQNWTVGGYAGSLPQPTEKRKQGVAATAFWTKIWTARLHYQNGMLVTAKNAPSGFKIYFDSQCP